MAKKKLPAKAAKAQRGAKESKKPNPFELKGSKRKFEVVGRRDKEGKKNVIQSREAAVNKRKKTLLVEYRQLRKANTFIDRRFGEDDPRLDEEDRALARFQAQRVREARRGSKFALADDGDAGGLGGGLGVTLTHGGRSLDELEDLSGRPDALADMDDAELAELERELHFGGGGDGDGDAGGGEGRRKSRKEIMEEIIAKSKAFKAARQKQKDEDEERLEALDATFKDLVGEAAGRGGAAAAVSAAAARGAGGGGGGALAGLLKPPGFDKGRKVAPDNADDAEYDRAARELVFEAKGHAGERTLTPEELQERERLRLEALEKQRLKRMRGDGSDDEAGGEGGFAARRRKRQHESGDALEENYALSDDEDEGESGSGDDDDDDADAALLSALDARRRERAAGDHPLQEAFREQAARLAAKYGVEVPGAGGGSDEDEGEDEEGEEGESGSGEEGSSGSGDEAEEEDEEEEEGEEGASDGEEEGGGAAAAAAEARRQSNKAASSSGKAAAAPAEPRGRDAGGRGAARAGGAAAALEGPLDLPFTIPVPQRYEQFAALVAGRPAGELALAIQRIRAFNAAALATDNKRQLQVLYGTLVQHFAMVAGESPVPAARLDVLTQALLAATQEVPYYATTVARARLARMQDQLTAALKDPLAAPRAGWPGPRQVLQLRLFSLLFPVTDKRHPVATPLQLLMGRYLAQCPVPGPQEAALGLLVASLALQAAAPAGRCVPEAVAFLAAALRAFAPDEPQQQQRQQQQQQQQQAQVVSLFAPGCLAFSPEALAAAAAAAAAGAGAGKKKAGKATAGGGGGAGAAAQLPAMQLYPLLSLEPRAAECGTDGFKLRLLAGVAAAARAAAAAAAAHFAPAAPPLLAPLLAAAESLAARGAAGALPWDAAVAVAALASDLRSTISEAAAGRAPLVQSFRAKARAPKEYTPRFEEDFHSKGDYDHDRARAERKKLQRELVKEKRGAMRELRRDAAFMAAERDRERTQVDAERMANERSFYSELQAQEANFRSGGQAGMHKGKRKAK